MSDYIDRIVKEKEELDDKAAKLDCFTGTDLFKSLHELDRLLMVEQLSVMVRYSEILSERLKRAKK